MSKLFALEDAEIQNNEVELETTPEEGEVADVQLETAEGTDEIEDQGAAIDEGVAAADQMEEVEDTVADAAEGEGLTPVAAEAIRLAVEAICARVGANPKAIYSLYATENFASPSSRKANTKFALEGIGEFLKNLWERIKAAVSSLIQKVTAFWNKHVSSLGRALKALESMKQKVSASKGSPTMEAVTAPSSLLSIFPCKATLGIEQINVFSKTLDTASNQLKDFKVLDKVATTTSLPDVALAVNSFKSAGQDIKFGSESDPLPGGKYFNWNFKLKSEPDDGVEILTIETEEDHGEYQDGRKDAQMDFAGKDKLKALITDTITNTKTLIKYRDEVTKRNKIVNDNMNKITKKISERDDSKDSRLNNLAKINRTNMRNYSLILSKGPAIEAKLTTAKMLFISGVLQYAAICLKNQRKA